MTRRRLSEHFVIEEFDCHDGTPVPQALVNDYQRLARRYLEPLRSTWGACRVHSGFRTSAHNERVGGAPHSLHRGVDGAGVAADVSFARGRPADWARSIEELGRHGGLGIYASWIHVDSRPGSARW